MEINNFFIRKSCLSQKKTRSLHPVLVKNKNRDKDVKSLRNYRKKVYGWK